MPDQKPYRERVELFATDPKGQIYGGYYPRKRGFGTFGGGVDPGEDLQEAAAREFKEESGYSVKNVRPAPVSALKELWKAPPKGTSQADAEKFNERRKEFKGSLTHYFLGDIKGGKGRKDTEDALYNFKRVQFRPLSSVISKHEKDLEAVTDPAEVKRMKQRLGVLQALQQDKVAAMPFKSKAQQRFMFAAEDRGEVPEGTAQEWADATKKKKGGIKALPEKIKEASMKKTANEMAKIALTRWQKEVNKASQPNSVEGGGLFGHPSLPREMEHVMTQQGGLAQLEARNGTGARGGGWLRSFRNKLLMEHPDELLMRRENRPARAANIRLDNELAAQAASAASKSKLLRNLGIGGAVVGAAGLAGIALPLALRRGKKENAAMDDDEPKEASMKKTAAEMAKVALPRWEKVLRESPEILEQTFNRTPQVRGRRSKLPNLTDMDAYHDLESMQRFMKAKDAVNARVNTRLKTHSDIGHIPEDKSSYLEQLFSDVSGFNPGITGRKFQSSMDSPPSQESIFRVYNELKDANNPRLVDRMAKLDREKWRTSPELKNLDEQVLYSDIMEKLGPTPRLPRPASPSPSPSSRPSNLKRNLLIGGGALAAGGGATGIALPLALRGKKESAAMDKEAFWGRKKYQTIDQNDFMAEQRATRTPEELLDTDLHNALYGANQWLGGNSGILHRPEYKLVDDSNVFYDDYASRIKSLAPDQKKMITDFLWGAQAPKTAQLLNKTAYNPAKDYWDSTWWGRSADRKKRKANAQEELMSELSQLSPEELQKRLGKQAAASGSDFIDKMKAKATKGVSATADKAKSVMDKKDKLTDTLRGKAGKGVDAVSSTATSLADKAGKGVGTAASKMKSVIGKKTTDKVAEEILNKFAGKCGSGKSMPPKGKGKTEKKLPPWMKQKKKTASQIAEQVMGQHKTAATRWEQVFRESPEILEKAIGRSWGAGTSTFDDLSRMKSFMKRKDALQQGMHNIEPSQANVDQVKQVMRNFGQAEPRLDRLGLRRGIPSAEGSAITQGAALDAYKKLPFKGMGSPADPGSVTREYGRDLMRGETPALAMGDNEISKALQKAVGPTPNLPNPM